jgi:hypothetical protein
MKAEEKGKDEAGRMKAEVSGREAKLAGLVFIHPSSFLLHPFLS